ncbi:hypothetical protein [Candidatus Oscillochloris fontis]|uniref:hypothetical protein n=1 Tax=Candidatus Oscillochloris fontis TaxID=2496868 RepID=UPI00101D8B62|nr:hypothetical protein [Candidatus Oscillochloris fontis]
MSEPLPTPLTDLRRRAPIARTLIRDVLTEMVGEVEVVYDFYREWNGCWLVNVKVSGAASAQLSFTLMDTPSGGMLALPRPMPSRWRSVGVRATDGTRWSLSEQGALVRVG